MEKFKTIIEILAVLGGIVTIAGAILNLKQARDKSVNEFLEQRSKKRNEKN